MYLPNIKLIKCTCMYKITAVCVVCILFFSCKAPQKGVFYSLNDFNITKASELADSLKQLPQIRIISIVNNQKDHNGFWVNNVNIFNDTIQSDEPNFYSYKRLANEIGVNKKSLNQLLLLFSQIKASEFVREKEFYLFPVEEYAVSKQTGYVFIENQETKAGDTLLTKKVIGDKIVLRKQVKKSWFQYESAQ